MGAHEHDHSYNCGCSYCTRKAQLRAAVKQAERELTEIEHLACDALIASGGAWTDQLEKHRERVLAARKAVDHAKQEWVDR